VCPARGSAYRALSSESAVAYGLSPAFVVHDELGVVRGPRSELFEALETGSAAQLTRTNGCSRKGASRGSASAGIWRAAKDFGEAFTMLTMPLGPDIAPYYDRQIAILDRADWCRLAQPVNIIEGNPEAGPCGQPCRRTGGLGADRLP